MDTIYGKRKWVQGYALGSAIRTPVITDEQAERLEFRITDYDSEQFLAIKKT